MWNVLKSYKPRHTVVSALNYHSKLRRFDEKFHPQLIQIIKKSQSNAQKTGAYNELRYAEYNTMLSVLFTSQDLDANRIIDLSEIIDLNWYIDDLVDEQTSDFNKELNRTQQMNVLRYIGNIWDGFPHEYGHDTAELNEFLDTLRVSDELQTKIENCSIAAHSAANKIGSNAPSHFFRQYTAALKAHLGCQISDGRYPTKEEYIIRKKYQSGMVHTLMGIEYASENYLFDHRNAILASILPPLHEMKDATIDIGGISNDLLSLPKEAKNEPRIFPTDNIFSAILQPTDNTVTQNCFTDAVDNVIETVNQRTNKFAEQRMKCLEGISERGEDLINAGYELDHIYQYLEHLERFAYGCFEWQLSTDRYLSPRHMFSDLRGAQPQISVETNEKQRLTLSQPKIDSPSSSQTEDHDLSNGVVSQDPSNVGTQVVLVIPPSYSVVHAL